MPSLDQSVPSVLVRIGRYPLDHGALGAVRSLGRTGVSVYAITEDRYTPVAVSRFLDRRFVWPTSGAEDESYILDGLTSIGRRFETPAVVIPTDDEAAVFVAEHAGDLGDWYIAPAVPPTLPRQLASKQGLYKLCMDFGIPTPRSSFPSDFDQVACLADSETFPLVVKNLEPWLRLTHPLVPGTTCFQSPEDLISLAANWGDEFRVVVQEYLPAETSEDWFVSGYFGQDSEVTLTFTGTKLRTWPPYSGVATFARTVANPSLENQAREFCRAIGYCGIVDMDWRLDRRDGSYKLLDCNPRMGSQFRLFETTAGIDVVRALHLDLTGRPIPPGPQVEGRHFVVENLDAAARWAYRSGPRATRVRSGKPESEVMELAWGALDDPLPFLSMFIRSFCVVMARFLRKVRRAPGGAS